MLRIFLSLSFLLLLPLSTHAAGADLAIKASDVRFSETTLVAGDEVRIYATVENVSAEDISGYVLFYQGSVPIGSSQVVSLIAGGNPEDVFVDFVVPSGDFNIRAEIKGTDPADTNNSNDTAITPMFTPVLDDDRDGIANGSDNCPSHVNPDQFDSDLDGQGNVCDDDDDNDGLTDEVEAELGTDPTKKDTDGDGVLDPNDAYPLDPNRSSLEEPKPEPKPDPEPEPIEQKKTLAEVLDQVVNIVKEEIVAEPESIPELIAESEPSEVEEVDEDVPPEELVQFSPNAIFSYQRDKWNEYTFEVLGPIEETFVYEWDFNDGVTSSRSSVTHIFEDSGTYEVSLSIQSGDGEVSSESTMIRIPFWSFQNRMVMVSLISLSILLLIALGFTFSAGKRLRESKVVSKVLAEDKPSQAKRKSTRKKKVVVVEEDDE